MISFTCRFPGLAMRDHWRRSRLFDHVPCVLQRLCFIAWQGNGRAAPGAHRRSRQTHGRFILQPLSAALYARKDGRGATLTECPCCPVRHPSFGSTTKPHDGSFSRDDVTVAAPPRRSWPYLIALPMLGTAAPVSYEAFSYVCSLRLGRRRTRGFIRSCARKESQRQSW